MNQDIQPDVQPLGDLHNISSGQTHDIERLVKMAEIARLAADRECLLQTAPHMMAFLDKSNNQHLEPSPENAENALATRFPRNACFDDIIADQAEDYSDVKRISVEFKTSPPDAGFSISHAAYVTLTQDHEDVENNAETPGEYRFYIIGPTMTLFVELKNEKGRFGEMEICISKNAKQLQNMIRNRVERMDGDGTDEFWAGKQRESLELALQRIFKDDYEAPEPLRRGMKP